jgi:N-acetylglutamate synthase-like GNAT family acetyltransferase
MKVRLAKEKDAKQCVQISSMRDEKGLKKFLNQSDVRWLVIENDTGAIVGIGVIHLWQWNKVAWLWDLTIDKNERNKGYGRTLLKGMIEEARKMGALVLMEFSSSKVTPLADLLFQSGFRICGINDRMFPGAKDSSAVYYGYDL